MKIGVLTAGGDCPGLNAAIRGVSKTAILKYKMRVYGIASGFKGLLTNEVKELTEDDVSGILTLGGTILGTSREKPFRRKDEESINKPEVIKYNYKQNNFDALVCIGGNGTMRTAKKLSDIGLNIIGIPKTIDNDVWGTDQTFGFETAYTIATEAIDRLHTTANSHNRTMVIEVMGHHAGWIALYAGLAGGGDVILMPELGFDAEVVAEYLIKRSEQEKKYSIVVVAEGLKTPKKSAGHYVGKQITKLTGLEIRQTTLGYLQRGGAPTPADRILATQYGNEAVKLIANGNFGRMVNLKNQQISSIPLEEVADKLKLVDKNHPYIRRAVQLGSCVGVKMD